MRKTLLVTAMLSALAARGPAQVQMTSAQDIPRIVAAAHGTVVLLKTFDRQGRVIGLGSGFRIAGGRFVTNAHVVVGATRVEIFDDTGALLGIARSADMLSTTVDLAILSSVGPRAPYLMLASVPPAVGEQVIVIGAPEGLTNTVSNGIVSARRKIGSRQLLQISAPISPGSSGGPVLNARGEVVGVSESILREGQNLNFAVPVSDVLALAASRPGQFEFPAATDEVAQDSPRSNGPTRSSAASPLPTLEIGTEVDGQLTRDDKIKSGGYVDYFRLEGAQGGSVSIFAISPDFTPLIGVVRVVGDSVVEVGFSKAYAAGKSASVTVKLSADATYLVGLGATTNSRAKMGGYSLMVSPEPEQSAPSQPAAVDGRWLGAAVAKDYYSEFDRTRITPSGNGTYFVWERAAYGTAQTTGAGKSYDVFISQDEISCSDNRYRFISGVAYLKGDYAWSTSGPASGQWQNTVPESMGEIEGQVICAYIKAHGL
jgi:Trypsin-like peptidase domain/Surface-adhesin protein E